MITVSDLVVNSVRLEDVAEKNRNRLDKIQEEQHEKELDLIQTTNSFCPLEKDDRRIATATDIERAFKDGFGDASALKAVMCTTNTLALFPLGSNDDVRRSFRMRHYLSNLEQIEGNNRNPLTADVEVGDILTSLTPFVVKAPQQASEETRKEALHEYFVGAFGTNAQRDKNPNFVYTLGMFKCAPPYISAGPSVDERRVALTYCQSADPSDQVNYLLLENMPDTVTLQDWIIGGASFDEYLPVLIQLIGAINTAANDVGFTHYDLHSSNVLVRSLGDPIYIHYDGIGYVKTKHVATMIDFGRSHIKIDGQDFGYNGVEYSVFPIKAFPMFDVFKILCFTLYDAMTGSWPRDEFRSETDHKLRKDVENPSVFYGGKRMLSYFIGDRASTRAANFLAEARVYYYTLPLSEENNVSPLEFYNRAIRDEYAIVGRLVTPSRPSGHIYGCAENDDCMSLRDAIHEYSSPMTSVARMDPYVYYDMAVSGQPVPDMGDKLFREFTRQMRIDTDAIYRQFFQIYRTYAIPRPNESRSMIRARQFVEETVALFDCATRARDIERITALVLDRHDSVSEPDYTRRIDEILATAPVLNSSLRAIEDRAGTVYDDEPSQNQMFSDAAAALSPL